jgi:hypothetical protein
MSDEVSYRLHGMEIASLAANTADPEVATRYRTLAAAYMALARFHERISRYHLTREEGEGSLKTGFPI